MLFVFDGFFDNCINLSVENLGLGEWKNKHYGKRFRYDVVLLLV